MATYNSEITSADLSLAMQQPEVYQPIFKAVTEGSSAMRLARRLPNMSRNTTRMTVTNALPVAYFQTTGTSLKQSTEMKWAGKTLTAEEIACYVPIAEDLLMDTANTGYDLWAEITPEVGNAMGKIIDAAIYHGTNLPSTWITNTSGTAASLVAGATSASNTVTAGTGTDIYDDIFGTSGVLALMEAQGFEANGFVGPLSAKGTLRQVRAERTATGAGLPMFESRADGGMTLGGLPAYFPKNGAVDSTAATLIAGDWEQLVYSIRQDIQVKVLDQAVISDGDGSIVFNLPQQDMVALRFTFRVAFQISNYVTQAQGTEASRYPFSILVPAGT